MKSGPRLLLLTEARAYLAGLDPRTLGIKPWTAHPLRFDRLEIDAILDQRLDAGARRLLGSPANDQTVSEDRISEELASLDARLAARTSQAPRHAPGRKA